MTRQKLTHANTHDAHANAANKLTQKLTHFTVTGIAAGQKLTRKLTHFTVTQSTNSRQILTRKLTRFTFSIKPQVKNSRETHATYSRTPLSKEREGGPTPCKHPTHPKGHPMKTYRRHNCTRTHRTWTTFAKCIWPRALWIHGDGAYASVARCGRGTTVQLCQTTADAHEMKQLVDDTGCGGLCQRRHEVIRLIRAER